MENATPGTQLARKLSGLSTSQPGSHIIQPAAAAKKAGVAGSDARPSALWNRTNSGGGAAAQLQSGKQRQKQKQHGSASAITAAASPMSDVKTYGRSRSAFSSRGTPPPMISSELLGGADDDGEALTPKQAEAPPVFVDTMESPPQFLIRASSAPLLLDDAQQHPELETAQAPTFGLLHRPVAIRGADGWLTNEEATQTQALLPTVALGRAASADSALASSSWRAQVQQEGEEGGGGGGGGEVVITPTNEGVRPRRRSSRSSARRGRSLSLSFGANNANGAGVGGGLSRSHGNFTRPSSLHICSSDSSNGGAAAATAGDRSSPSAPAVKRPSTSSSPSMQHRTRFSITEADIESPAAPAGSVITAESKRRRTTSSDDEGVSSKGSIELLQGGIPSTEEVFLASDANGGGCGTAAAAAGSTRRRSARSSSSKKKGGASDFGGGNRAASDPGQPKRAGGGAAAAGGGGGGGGARASTAGGFPRRGTVSGTSAMMGMAGQRRLSAPRVGLLPDGPNIRGDRLKECILPTTGTHHKHHTSVRLISSATVSKLINGGFNNLVDGYVVVDCRFPFEYEGGHINTAVNFWTMERTVANFLQTPIVDITSGERIPIIFHCEFSSVRAPTMFKYLRDLDNTITFGNPNLIYPELYVMEKGYEKFYAEHPDDCTPRQYIRMKDKKYASDNEQCENILSRSREEANQKKWLQNGTVQSLNELVREHGMEGLAKVKLQRPGSPTPGGAGRQAPRTPSTPAAQILA